MTAVNTADTDFPLLNVRRVAGNIGAEIRDIRLSASLDADTFAQLDAAEAASFKPDLVYVDAGNRITHTNHSIPKQAA